MEARVEWLTVVGNPETWRSLGLVVTEEGTIPLMGASLRIVSDIECESAVTGLAGWTLSGVDESLAGTLIDGLATQVVAAPPPVFTRHEMGASGLDHVVVMTPDLERTSTAIADATGCQLKRVREVGTMRQGFHRIGRGGLIVELVERPEIDAGPASFWGVVINVDDLDLACARIGDDRISVPKDAVQPGRRIATVRADADLGLPVALMTT